MIDRKTFFNKVRAKPAGGSLSQNQVDGFNYVLDVFERDYRWPDQRWLAYCLATAWHETAATMQPIKEYGSTSYLQGKPYWPYIGRGYVQLTWEANYRKMGDKIGTSLLGPDMDKALDPTIAAEVMFRGMKDGDFTGKRLADYFSGSNDDPVNARRIINGTDKASLIAGYHRDFLAALKAASVVEPPQPPVTPQPPPVTPPVVDETVWIRRSEVAQALREMANAIDPGGA